MILYRIISLTNIIEIITDYRDFTRIINSD